MVVTRREKKKANDIKLRQPDRSGPTEKTLLQMAQERNLFDLADQKQGKNVAQETSDEAEDKDGAEDGGLPSSADRVMDTLLYAVCLAMLHFTLDFLVQQQYAMEMDYRKLTERTFQALMSKWCLFSIRKSIPPTKHEADGRGIVFAALVHALHPHPANTTFIPGLPQRYHAVVRRIIFFTASLASGCYLIHISNKYSYMAVLKRSPPLGCLWIWSIIEMDLLQSLLSLAMTYAFFWYNGYKI